MLSAKYVFLIFAAVVVTVQCANHLIGGETQLGEDDFKDSVEILKKSLAFLDAEDGPSYTLSKVNKATKQVVSGILYKYDAEIIDGNKTVKKCKIDIWSQPWIKKGIQVTFNCEGEQKFVKNHSP